MVETNKLPLLEIRNIQKKFFSSSDEVTSLEDISFNVNKGEFVSILGPSGCGKTTLLSILSGLLKQTSGTVNFNYENHSIGYMFQKDTLFEWRTILENCYLPLEINKLTEEKYKVNIDRLLQEFNIWEFRDKYPRELSGGMRQRVALIRSLATMPDLLLLDEPFSAIDYQTKLKLSQDILDTLKKRKKTAILVTHNIQEAISLSDKIIILSKRPAIVKKELLINFSNQRNIALITKEEKYNEYFEEVWQEVMEDGH